MSIPEPLRQLTAKQAAARLGVKVETIYAYVSRGLLERISSEDGRTSLFDARHVERLAGKRKGGAKTGGLSVVLGTGLTSIESERLSYRGLDAADLARRSPFEAVADWMWLGEAKPGSDLEVRAPWHATEEAINAGRVAQEALPSGTGTSDRLRVIASVVSTTDPMRFDTSPDAVAVTARRLISALVDCLPLRSVESSPALHLDDRGPVEDSIASRLWPRLSAETATRSDLASLNAMLVLTLDHGLAASTMAARVAASVRADPYSIVAAGLATLSGPLHGGAAAKVHRLLTLVDRPEHAVAVLGDYLRREKTIPGFGHLIYKGWDPRARILLEFIRASQADAQRLEVIECILELLLDRASVFPNIDFTIGALTYLAEMVDGAGETIFGIARTAGWLAHALEEYQESPLRFRPRAHYIGPAAVVGS
jgi:citrate synthase